MATSPVGLGTKNHCASEGHQQIGRKEKSSAVERDVRQSPASKAINTEAEESPLMRAVIKQQLAEI
jgi:hypothetical protein